MQTQMVSASGKQMLVRYCDSFIFVGDMELLQCLKNYKVMETTTTCVFLSIDINRYRDKLLQDRKFLLYMCRGLADKLNVFEDNQFQNKKTSAKEKVIMYILERNTDGIFKENITKMCDYIDVSYRHIYRIIDDLIVRKRIERCERGYKILSVEELKKEINND